eukprot:800443-Amphidinium_carterae.1
MAAWHETAPAYWVQVLQGATGLYSRYCTLSSTQKTLFEANEQIDVIAGGGYLEQLGKPCLHLSNLGL